MDIVIPENARVFLGGMTGSGKTFMAKHLLQHSKRLVVMNVKDDPDLIKDLSLLPETTRNWRKLAQGYAMKISVSHKLGQDDAGMFNHYADAFRRAYLCANVRVYVDELFDVMANPQNPPTYLRALYTRGRQAIKNKDGEINAGNMGAFACSQRPSRIPLFTLTESSHFFIFRLTNRDDRDRIAQYTHPALAEPIPDADEHGFWYFDRETRTPIYSDGKGELA